MSSPRPPAGSLYLDLMKRCLTRISFPERYREATGPLAALLARTNWALVRRQGFDRAAREVGKDWPLEAETMIGLRRLENLQVCVEAILDDGVPGDLIETGVWRGGAVIFMRAILAARGDLDRTVWVADSFAGLPPPDPAHPADAGDRHHTRRELAIPRDEVQANFRRYGLLDDQVRFLEGWFSETLPTAPIEALALIRLDGDMYGSTIDALNALYPKLSPGGFVIVDDYGLPGARQAVDDFRRDHGIEDEIVEIDWTGVFWRRS